MSNQLVEEIRRTGHRLTQARQAIAQVLETAEGHLSPAELLQRGRKAYPQLSRATLYRTLELLTQIGAIRPIYLRDCGPFFARVNGGHSHLVCSSCGQVVEFQASAMEDLTQRLAQQLDFQLDSYLLEFYGRCRSCQAGDRPAAATAPAQSPKP